jgi:hypothetical protein
MRLPSRSRVFALAALSAFAGAGLGHWAWPRDARAQPQSSISTVFVPSEGIVFRTLDGRPIARLSREASGGVIELYDEDEQVTTRLTAATPPMPRQRQAECACAPTAQSVMLDDVDPWSVPYDLAGPHGTQ